MTLVAIGSSVDIIHYSNKHHARMMVVCHHHLASHQFPTGLDGLTRARARPLDMQQVAKFEIIGMGGLEKLIMPSLQGVDGGFFVNDNDNLKYIAFPLLQVCLMLAAPAPV